MNALLFAYGSLLTGTGHPALDRLLREGTLRLGRARMRGRVVSLGAYPGAVDHARDWVQGWLLRMRRPAYLLRHLDRYEGIDPADPARGEFSRCERPIWRIDRRAWCVAWVYLYNRDARHRPRCPGGDALRRRQPRLPMRRR